MSHTYREACLLSKNFPERFRIRAAKYWNREEDSNAHLVWSLDYIPEDGMLWKNISNSYPFGKEVDIGITLHIPELPTNRFEEVK